MKAVNDYRILMSNIPYYQTGIAFNEYEIVYYTGINAGTYTDNTISPPITQIVQNPDVGKTGYYYLKKAIYPTSGKNVFWTRPDSDLNYVDFGANELDWWVQNFFFTPTYGSSVEFSANYYENIFQDNYKYILGKSENVIQVKATLNFQGISDNEARALNHFYQNYFTITGSVYGQGMKPVEMSLFYPHEKTRPFYLKSISNDLENVDFNNVTLEVESPFISLSFWKEKLIPFRSSENYYYDTKTYNKHDYVFEYKNSSSLSKRSSRGFFYYSGDTSSVDIDPYSTSAQNNWTQKFYFSPDLVETLNFESLMYKNDLGHFYLNQNVGLNPNFFDLQLSFNNRSDKEAKAILHFLENHNGLDFFEYDMYPPYTGTRAFFCPEWSHTYNFADNHTIKARLIESKFNYITDETFDSSLIPSGINYGFIPVGFTKEQIVKIKNNETKPVTYTISADSFDASTIPLGNVDVSFVQKADGESDVKTAQGGGYVDYSIISNLNTKNALNLSPSTFKYTGYYTFTQEKENDGIIADNDLQLFYSGAYYDVGQSISTPFLSGLKTCIASPFYDSKTNQVCFKTRFTIPESGYYFNNFSGRLTTTSGAFVAAEFTGSSKDVTLNITDNLYSIGTPGSSYFEMDFSGVSFGVDYYIRVSGLNTDYNGAISGDYVFATGVNRITDSVDNDYVISGLTTGNLNYFNINPPSIRIDKTIETLNITNEKATFFDLYKYIENNASFGTYFALYSGIRINFDNVYYGPFNADTQLTEYNTGTFIITGNYSSMPSGIILNFKNSNIIGKGGNVYKTKDSSNPVYSGRNAFYINCSGLININKDLNTIFAAGGGAGDNLLLTDIVDITPANKYGNLKSDFNSNDPKFSTLRNEFNKDAKYLNLDTTATKGSSILYDFFDPTRTPSPYQVYGGAGGGAGKGTGLANFKFVNDANTLIASPNYNLNCIVEYAKILYPTTEGD
jgi:phage-related protein